MSWWDATGFGDLATKAIKQAQKKIDKVLDIKEEEGSTSQLAADTTPTTATTESEIEEPDTTTDVPDGGEFWNAWLPSETKKSESTKPSKLDLAIAKTKSKSPGPGKSKSPGPDKSKSPGPVKSKSPSLTKLKSPGLDTLTGEIVKDDTESYTQTQLKSNDSVSKSKSKSEDIDCSSKLTTTEESKLVKTPDVSDVASVSSKTSDSYQENAEDRLSGITKFTGEVQGTVKKPSPLKLGSKHVKKIIPPKSEGKTPEELLVPKILEKSEEEKQAEREIERLLSADSVDDIKKTDIIEFTPSGSNIVSSVSKSDIIQTETVTDKSETSTVNSDPIQTETVTDKSEAPVIQGSNLENVDLQAVDSSGIIESGWDDADPLQSLTESSEDVLSKSDKDDTTYASVVDKQTESGENKDIVQDMAESGSNWEVESLDIPGSEVSESSAPESQDVDDSSNNAPGTENEYAKIETSAAAKELVEGEIDTSSKESCIEKPVENPKHESQAEPEVSAETVDTVQVDSAKDNVQAQEDTEKLNESMKSSLSYSSADTVEELCVVNKTLTSEDFDKHKDEIKQPDIIEAEMEAETKTEIETKDIDLPSVHDDKDQKLSKDSKTDSTVSSEHKTESPVQSDSKSDTAISTDNAETAMSSSTSLNKSSSFVKHMIEEAMTESIKDNESHTDSHTSSCSIVRIESGQNSGHTSADEIETTTSSDIEIISHISTPTPNGDGRGGERPFDLSPLRHAFSRGVRRNSPPGHRRSDSGSSGRNSDEVYSPENVQHRLQEVTEVDNKQEAAMQKSESQSSNDPYEVDKLLKDKKPASVSLDPIAENLESTSHSDCSHIAEKLASTAEVLEARERRLLEISKENIDLQETNNILRSQLKQLEETREVEMADLNELTEEFAQRISDSEKTLKTVLREKEVLKKKLQETESELARRSDSGNSAEKLLKEKDQTITELMEEGERLSREQLKSNNIIKKLRVKEKDSDSTLKSQKEKIESMKAELERLQKILDNKCDIETKQIDAISQLNNAVKKQEKEIERLKSELEDATEKSRSMQSALDNSYKEIGELHKSNVAKQSEVAEAALSAEMQAKQELQMSLERFQHQSRQEQEALVHQIEDLRLSVSRQEREHGRREDVLRQEISDLQQRLQESEERNQELTHGVTAATRPLLRQIENIQSTYAAQSSSYEKIENNLTNRLSETQQQLAAAVEKERMAGEKLMDISAKMATYESQVSTLRQEKSKIQAQLEMEKARIEVLEDARHSESAKLSTAKQHIEKELSEQKKEKLMLENQLEVEKMKVDSEKKKNVLLQEHIREKEILLSQAQLTRASPTLSRENSMSQMSTSMMSNVSNSVMESSFMSFTQEEPLEKVLSPSTPGPRVSLYDSVRGSNTEAVMESLQSQLKQKNGEIIQLQREIQDLERTRESMARELVNITTAKDELEEKLSTHPHLVKEHKELNQRHSALLQMYGELEEQNQELKLDLQDVKEMYKLQIEELISRQ